MGNIKRGSIPPEDVPDWEYGVQVINLSEDVHNLIAKTSNFEGIKEWSAYLGGVMECILSANFELTFKNTADYQAYNMFQEKLSTEYIKLSKIYFNAFQSIEANFMSQKSGRETPNLQNFKNQVASDKYSVETSLNGILDHKDSQKWGMTEQFRWKVFCSNLDMTYEKMLKDLESVLKFPIVVSEYEERVKKEVVRRIDEFQGFQGLMNKDQGFKDIFSSILQEAKKDYKPIADDVPNLVAGIYAEHAGNVNSFSSTRTTCGQFNPVRLRNMVDVMLQNETRFSDHIVREVIKQTSKYLEDEYSYSKEDQARGQTIVKETLQNSLKKIQERWDNEHNVAKRLERSRPRLKLFFNNVVNGLSLAVTLKSELETLLMANLDLAFNDILANEIVEECEKWKEKDSRACVDLHLLLLAEKNKVNELLDFVKNMPKHYKIVTRAIISSMLVAMFKRYWGSFIKKVAECVMKAGNKAKTAAVYVEQLAEALRKCQASKLAFALSSVNFQRYEGELPDEFYSHHIPELGRSLLQKEQDMRHRQSLEELIPDMKRRLSLMGNKNILARCAEDCPLCACPCWKSGSHDLHDTVHQPRGLSGATGTSGKLLEQSCTSKFRYGYWYEYLWFAKDFQKNFKNWEAPSQDSPALKIREYIFYNFESKLSIMYANGIRCNLPENSRYNHDIGILHNELRNVLGTKYDDMCVVLNDMDISEMMKGEDDKEEEDYEDEDEPSASSALVGFRRGGR